MKRKLLAVFLSVCMALSLMPTAVLAAGPEEATTSEITDVDSLKNAIAAAEKGETVEIPAGTYEIGSLTINKAVSLKAEGAVTLNGSVIYKSFAQSTVPQGKESPSISWEGITLKATEGNSHQGLCFSTTVTGYTLNIENCTFDGWEYAIGVNSGATSNTLSITGTKFTNTGCAISMQDGNTLKNAEGTTTEDSTFAVQYFISGNPTKTNGYYTTIGKFLSDINRTNPDVNLAGDAASTTKVVFSADDLQAAVTAASGETTIYIGKDITLTSGLSNVSGKNLTIEGRGNTISYDLAGTLNGVFGNDNAPLYGNTTLSIKNLTIRNTDDAQGGYASIVGYNANGTSISYENCTFANLYAAVYVNPVRETGEGVSLSINRCIYENTQFAYALDKTTEGYPDLIQVDSFKENTLNGAEQEAPLKQTVYATVDGDTKAFSSIQAAVTAADENSTITVYPGSYDGNVTFSGKSLTIQAQHPAYVNGEKTADNLLSKFTGTFNTYGENSNSFNENQKIVIEGFAFTGNGLKVGNQNYNSVGNLTVRNCTFACGANLSEVNGNNYAGQNYMIKTNGSADDEDYATVVVENNYFSGTPVTNVYPVQLWDVDSATVTGNVMEFTENYNGQAIGVSKMEENAQVEVSGNSITNAAGGIYITTWELGGAENDQRTFTGTIEVTDNVMVNVGNESMDEIFIGYDRTAANENAPYGLLAGSQTVSGNTNNGSAVGATIVRGPESSDTKLITATFQNGDTVYTVTASPTAGETAITVTTPAAPADYGYNHFVGWSDGDKTYDANTQVEITTDTTFTAIWTYIPPANPNYKITIGEMENGSVTADPTAAKAGATVTLTATPDEGYAVGTVTVTDRFGDAVRVTEQADGTYTFTMPDGQVSVNATFVASEEPAAEPFPDVDENDWFYDEVVYVYENGLMNGVENNMFAPNTATNRAMLATILYRLAGEPDVSGDMPFTDVATGTWYTDAVLWAAQNGIVNGLGENTFAPMNTLTREQLVTMLYRYAEAEGYDVSAAADLSGYPDAGKVQTYAQEAMSWAVAEGIVAGMDDGTLNPAGNATRAQIATILMRFCAGVAK